MKITAKIFISIIAVVFATLIISPIKTDAAFLTKAPPSHYDKGLTIPAASKTHKPLVVIFYADWCSACIKFVPEVDKYRKIYKGKYEFVLVNIDNKSSKKLAEEYYVASLPSVYLVNNKNSNVVYLNPAKYNNVSRMVVEFDRFLRLNK